MWISTFVGGHGGGVGVGIGAGAGWVRGSSQLCVGWIPVGDGGELLME